MKKLRIPLLLVTALFLSAFTEKQTEDLPQRALHFAGNLHSILSQDKEIMNRKFSSVRAVKRVDFIGYLGTDYQKMDEDNTALPTKVEKKGGNKTLKTTGNVPQKQVSAGWQIVSKENGAYYCLANNGREYRIDDMLDMGEPELKVYTGDHPPILVIGLSDMYESVYFIYCFKDGALVRLGQIEVAQREDVEINGPGKISLKIYPENNRIAVESYLEGVLAGKSRFSLPGGSDYRPGPSARTDTLLIESKKTAIFIAPTDEDMNRIILSYRSDEEFHSKADEAFSNLTEAITYLKQNGIELVYADTTCRILRFAGSQDIDLSDTVKIGNLLFNIILYNGHLPVIIPAAQVKTEAPDFFGLSLFDIVDKEADKPESVIVLPDNRPGRP